MLQCSNVRISITTGLIFSIILFADAANAARQSKFYVSPQGDDTNPGTQEAPWKSLAAAHEHDFNPGDTIYLSCGTTFEGGFVVKSSGTDKKPITFTSYGLGHAPALKNTKYGHLNGNAIQIKGSHVVVDGLYFEDCPKSPVTERIGTLGAVFIAEGANHNIVKNCEFTKTPVGIQIYGEHNLVTKNYIHDNNVPIRPHWGPMGIVVCSSNNEFSYNRFVNYCAPSNEYGHDGGAIEVNDGRLDKVNLKFHHNYSKDNQGFIENIQATCKFDNWIISHNVCDDFQTFLGLTNATNIRVEHNTVIRTRRHEGYNDVNWFNDDNSIVLRNNIFVLGNGVMPAMYHDDGPNQHHEYNLYYCIDRGTFIDGGNFDVVGTPLGKGEVIDNPLFVDFESRNLRLRQGSPAIDAAADMGYKEDMDNNPMPVGDAPDMGAYEFQKQ